MAIVIPLQIMGNGEFNSAFKGMRDAVKDFKDEVIELKRLLKQPLGSSSGSKQSAAAAAISQAGKAAKVATGPLQDLRNAHLNLQRAMAGGNQAQIWDAQHRVFTANNRFNNAYRAMNKPPAGQKGFGDLLRDAIMSSRVGIGANGSLQAMPLVSKLLPLLGEAGPVVVGMGLLVAAIKSLIDAAQGLATNQRELSQSRYTAGATYNEMSHMGAIGGMVGQSSEQVAQAARAFANEIASGGFAAGKFRGYGISDQPGPYGKVDKFANFERAIKILTQLPEDQAIRLARSAPSLEPYLTLRDASPEKMKELMDMQRDLITPESVRAAADFNIEMEELKLELQQIVPMLTPFVSAMAKVVRGIRFLLTGDPNAPSIIPGGPSQADKAKYQAEKTKADAAKAAHDRNTDAVTENTRELRRAREIIGGGQRANQALPAGWRYNMVNNQLDSLSNMIGPM